MAETAVSYQERLHQAAKTREQYPGCAALSLSGEELHVAACDEGPPSTIAFVAALLQRAALVSAAVAFILETPPITAFSFSSLTPTSPSSYLTPYGRERV